MAKEIRCDRCKKTIGDAGQCEKDVYHIWFSPYIGVTELSSAPGKAESKDLCKPCYQVVYDGIVKHSPAQE